MGSGFVVKSKESGPFASTGPHSFPMTLFRIYTCTLTGAIAIAAAGSLVWLGGRKKTPEQREALRRQRISAQGRITDGTVLDVQEFDSGTGHSGADGDLHLRRGRGAIRVLAGGDPPAASSSICTPAALALPPASSTIRYHPGNSIVVAEGWCGLRC